MNADSRPATARAATSSVSVPGHCGARAGSALSPAAGRRPAAYRHAGDRRPCCRFRDFPAPAYGTNGTESVAIEGDELKATLPADDAVAVEADATDDEG